MQTITVRHNNGTVSEASITPSVQVAFERHFKTGITVMANPATLHMEHMYWLAWYGCTAGQKNRPSFDDWLATVDDVVTDDEQEAEVEHPLAATPSSGASLPSPSSPAPA